MRAAGHGIIKRMQETAHHGRPAGAFAHPPRNVAALGIDPGMLVADFGAGSGAYVQLIARALRGVGRVYAIDIQRDLLRRIGTEARERGLAVVELIWADLEEPGSTKLEDGALDLVLISNLLFQVERKAALFKEAARLLHPAARLAIIDWQDSFGGLGPDRHDVVTKDAALALAQAAGFELIREFDAGAHHYGLLFRVPVGRRS